MMVTSETAEGMDGPVLTSVLQKQDALLSDIASQSRHPGSVVNLGPFDCVIFDGAPGDELGYHVQSMVDRGLLQARRTINEIVITPQGWEHLEQLRSPLGGNRSDIFVAMSFKEALRGAWEDGIKPGVAAAGYRAKRVDSDAHNDKIDDRIIAGIRACYAVVVDVTTQNAGAYFEAGFAMGVGRPVVWTVHEEDLPNLHFDTRQFRHIVWSNELDLCAKLTTHLLAVFGRGPLV
ncbi:nucleoside 2-deoxyribosyltransferase [Lysobacter sp. Root494]|uniref:nucleoside 2-deoxyribosyltransferase n=1 Tax=Lysobacter sp. Root494 TaxID=1736549 RepID=UPI001F2AD910|nr:nucleoside 2-deoxyribosyltransferase [Lysobacter sp. Root494]